MSAARTVDLVLASTSRYRQALLARLTTHFRVMAPDVDESRTIDESPGALAERLAREKARAVAGGCPDAIVIGSDQVAEIDGRVLGKPGSAPAAIAQLQASSGRRVDFHTAVCVIDTRGATPSEKVAVDLTTVQFRSLADDEIERYVRTERPFDCAGSFKAEGLGIALFEHIHSNDPTALVGLPLIALARLLRLAGLALP
jgi:septum formation protein